MAKKIFYKPADQAVAYTEVEIAELEKKLIAVYSEAEADIQKKMDDFTAKYQKQDLVYQKQLKEGLITQADYDDWKKGRVFVGKQWAAKKDEIAAVLYNSNKISTSMINMSAFDVFGENSNYMAYTMEHTAGVNFGFQVYNTDAVVQLIKDDPDLLPKWKVDQKKDYDWNRKNLNNAITQGIIQGESLSKISKRVSSSLAGKNENLMNTFAKTGMTQAQNSGRLERMEKGKALGINVKKKWVATLDGRTRYAHRELDGQIVDTDDDFKTEGYTIAYPGDPHAHPSLVYNCRCAITSSFDKYPSKYNRYDNIDGVPVKGMSYNEWKKAKENGENIKPVPFKKSTKKKSEDEKISKIGFSKISDGVKNLDEKAYKVSIDQIGKLEDKFNIIHSSASVELITENNGFANAYVHFDGFSPNKQSLSLCPYNFSRDTQKIIDSSISAMESGYHMPFEVNDTNALAYSVTHEYGHMIENLEVWKRNKDFYEKYAKYADVRSSETYLQNAQRLGIDPAEFVSEYEKANKQAKKNMEQGSREIYKEIEKIGVSKYGKDFKLYKYISEYGNSNRKEAFAEMFANSQLGKPNEAGECMSIWLERNGYGIR